MKEKYWNNVTLILRRILTEAEVASIVIVVRRNASSGQAAVTVFVTRFFSSVQEINPIDTAALPAGVRRVLAKWNGYD